jgi:hypothetical protein
MDDESPTSRDIDQEIRINELCEAAREAAGGEMTEWESPDCPPELAEQFWGNVLAYETAGETCHFNQLEALDIDLPAPEDLTDEILFTKLWEVIHGLARLNVFVSQTDHLSNRELYEHLWHESLREITADLPQNSGWTSHLDLLTSGSDEDNELYLKYYADEDERARWHNDFPNDVILPHVDRPYDRDRKLPKSPY